MKDPVTKQQWLNVELAEPKNAASRKEYGINLKGSRGGEESDEEEVLSTSLSDMDITSPTPAGRHRHQNSTSDHRRSTSRNSGREQVRKVFVFL